MTPFAVRCLCVGLAALGLGYGLLRADPPPAPKKTQKQLAQDDIIALSQGLDAENVSDRAKQIVKDHDSCDISSIFRPKRGGGPGIGKLTEAGYQDGIAPLVLALTNKKTITEAEIETHQADYLRVAKILQAMAQLAPHRGPVVVANYEKRAKDWEKVSADFKMKTAEFRKAIEEKDPKRLRLAAKSLHVTCEACHEIAF